MLDSRNEGNAKRLRKTLSAAAPTVAPSRSKTAAGGALGASHDEADLARIVEAWPTLAPALKAGILAMVEASRGATRGE